MKMNNFQTSKNPLGKSKDETLLDFHENKLSRIE